MGLHAQNHQGSIHFTMKEVAPLWCKFRSAEPQKNADLHLQYCEMIQEAIWHNETDDAFHLLVEGLQWYESTIDAMS